MNIPDDLGKIFQGDQGGAAMHDGCVLVAGTVADYYHELIHHGFDQAHAYIFAMTLNELFWEKILLSERPS